MQITDTTKQKWLDQTEKNLDLLIEEMDVLHNTHKNHRLIAKFSFGDEARRDQEVVKSFLDFHMILGIIRMDLYVATLVYLRGKFQSEAIYSARQISVIIIEGYKKIYNLILDDKKEKSEQLKFRNKSFWIRTVQNVIIKSYPEYQIQFEEITKKLDDYFEVNFEELSRVRHFSVHYDYEPSKFIDMVLYLDVDKTYQKLTPFMQILLDMQILMYQLLPEFQQRSEQFNDKILRYVKNKGIGK